MPHSRTVLGRTLQIVLAVAFAVAAYWSLRLAYADLLSRRDTVTSLQEAAGWTPGDADLHARLAELDTLHFENELQAAVENNSYHATARIRLGLFAEIDGDYEQAERLLLEAAKTDRTFVPCWALASYYFRRGNEQNFWIWARAAAGMSYGDTTALYRLCWRVTDNGDRILDRVIGKQPEPLVRYLLFLIEEDRLEAGMNVAKLLMADGGEEYLGVLVGYCERLLIHRDAARALEAWNALIAHNLLPYAPLEPETGRSLTNGDFAAAPLGRGFDWRLIESEGISHRLRSGALHISLSGGQAETSELLSQYLVLEPDTTYRLGVEWAPETPPAAAGLRWHASDPVAKTVLPIEGDPPMLTTSPHTGLTLLTLRCHRLRGATVWRGDVVLKSVQLERLRGTPRH